MAKKRTAARRAAPKREKVKTARKATRGRSASGSRKGKPATGSRPGRARGPRSQVLPGMEAVRSKKLDNICEGIGQERETMNAARTEEQSLIQSALRVMQQTDITTYRHARIELSRVPGAEKLRVRMTKEEGDASDGDLETAEGAEAAS